jgi:hypothetical protein
MAGEFLVVRITMFTAHAVPSSCDLAWIGPFGDLACPELRQLGVCDGLSVLGAKEL